MHRIAVALLLISATAHADSRAWTAAKQVLPDGLEGVMGVNAASIRASKLYDKVWPQLMAKAGDVQKGLEQIKTMCKLDVTTAIDSMVVGMATDDKGLIVVAFKGASQKDFDACMDKLSKTEGKPMTTVKTGAVTKYTADGKDIYIRWLRNDVAAMATVPDDKDLLAKLTVGGNKLKPIKTEAAVWAQVDKTQDLDPVHAKMSRAYGYADLKSGKVSTELHVVVDNSRSASEAAKQVNDQVAEAKKTNQLPPVFKPLLDTLAVKSTGSDVVLTAAMSEDDALSLVTAVAALLMH